MTTFRPLTDATLEAMLARRAARADPAGLLPEISAAVERTAQADRPAFARPDWAARFRASLRPIWVVVVVGLLVALFAAITLLAARPPDRPPLPLRYGATLETLTPGGNDYWSGATDLGGNVWAWSPGHLTRIEAVTGAVRTWTISDDEAFASAGIAAARDAGVWVIGKDALRRFDGDAFRTVIDAPGMAAGGEIWTLAEAPDGGLWAALGALGPRRWDGAAWVAVGEARLDMFATFVTVDPTDRVWAGGLGGGVSVYDGSGWATYAPSPDAPASKHAIRFIAVAPEGAVWVGTDGGVARLDGTAWSDLTPDIIAAAGASPAGSGAVSVAFGSDGTTWIAFVSDMDTGDSEAHVVAYDGVEWTSYGPQHGLPTGTYAAWVATTSTDVYVVTSPGVYQLNGASWDRVPPSAAEPGLVRQLLALSRDEVWVASDTGVFRYRHNAWVRDDPSDPESTGSGSTLARAPDGTLWAAGYFGAAVRDAERWKSLPDIEYGGPMAFGPDGTLWLAESHYPADQLEIDAVRLINGAWSLQRVGPSPLGWISTLAVARDGAVWAGSDGFFAPERSGIARFDGQAWERIRPLGSTAAAVAHIEAGPDGDVWVAFTSGKLARFDGTSWVMFGEADGLPRSSQITGVGPAVGPDGTVWMPTTDGLARFDGQRWTLSHAGLEFGRISVAPDGVVWVMGPSGVQRLQTVDAPS